MSPYNSFIVEIINVFDEYLEFVIVLEDSGGIVVNVDLNIIFETN